VFVVVVVVTAAAAAATPPVFSAISHYLLHVMCRPMRCKNLFFYHCSTYFFPINQNNEAAIPLEREVQLSVIEWD
jgi:hypothetical protein